MSRVLRGFEPHSARSGPDADQRHLPRRLRERQTPSLARGPHARGPAGAPDRPHRERRFPSPSIVRCPHEGPAARGAADLARPLRERLRLRRVRPGRSRLRRPSGAALPALARARSLAAVAALDRRLEPRLVGRLSRAPVLSSGLRAARRRAPRAPPLAALGGDVYRLLCAVVFLAPGLTTYALLARVVGDRWLALPGAFLALTLSADLRGGVEAGLRWGSLTTRLGLAWLPLLALALRPWIEGGRIPRWAPPLAALAILSHPSTLPSVAALLGLATALAFLGRPERRTLWQAGATVGLAFALTAFWSLPFAMRRSWVVPLAWGDLSLGLPADLPGRPVLLALGMTALTAWVAVGIRRRPFDALLAALPLVLVGALPRGRLALPAWLDRDRASAPPRRRRAGVDLGGGARGRRHRRPAPAVPGGPAQPASRRAARDRPRDRAAGSGRPAAHARRCGRRRRRGPPWRS